MTRSQDTAFDAMGKPGGGEERRASLPPQSNPFSYRKYLAPASKIRISLAPGAFFQQFEV